MHDKYSKQIYFFVYFSLLHISTSFIQTPTLTYSHAFVEKI